MAKAKAKTKPESVAAGDAADEAVAVDNAAEVAEAQDVHEAAKANTAELRTALAEAEGVEADAAKRVEELTVAPPIAGPRIHIEDVGFVRVKPEDVRERRLLIGGNNYEHVADVEDQGETVWSYRRM